MTAQEAKDGGTDEFWKSVNKAMDGVLFIDEAYDLDPVGDFKGRPIINEMLTLCENERDKKSLSFSLDMKTNFRSDSSNITRVSRVVLEKLFLRISMTKNLQRSGQQIGQI